MRAYSLIMLAICGLLGGCSDDKARVTVTDGTIDFRAESLDHQRFYLHDHRGKVVVLVFWSTWCTVCKSELVEFKSFAPAGGKDLVIAAVCNDPENMDDLKRIAETLKLNYPLLLDKKAAVFNKLELAAVPTTVVIDKGGKASFVREGYDAAIMKQIKTAVESMLADGGTQ